jgi:hypothetical protein
MIHYLPLKVTKAKKIRQGVCQRLGLEQQLFLANPGVSNKNRRKKHHKLLKQKWHFNNLIK